jgi:hypothetical protein
MEDKERKRTSYRRSISTPEHYKTKAKAALKTLDAYEMNFNVSKGYVNSAEVYGSLNDIYFANRSIMQASDNFNAKASELDYV